MAVRIDRCTCFGRTFAELKRTAERTGAETVAELQAHAAFGQRCKLCHPYVRRMLRTGEVVFHEIITSEGRETKEREIE
jgi:bacterioferritin-associated ferredoxin